MYCLSLCQTALESTFQLNLQLEIQMHRFFWAWALIYQWCECLVKMMNEHSSEWLSWPLIFPKMAVWGMLCTTLFIRGMSFIQWIVLLNIHQHWCSNKDVYKGQKNALCGMVYYNTLSCEKNWGWLFYKSAKNLAKFHFPTGTKLAQPETDKPIELYPWTIPSATCAEVSSSSIDLGLLPAQKIVVQQQVVAYTMAAVA